MTQAEPTPRQPKPLMTPREDDAAPDEVSADAK